MRSAKPEIEPSKQRRDLRTYLARPVYVQWSGPAGERFEEVRTMRDFSAGGLYFFTETSSYFVGMRLHVIPAFGVLNLEYLAEVVRIEQTEAGDHGVALRLLAVRHAVDARQSAAKSAFESFVLADSPNLMQDSKK
jgi:hypothetical protein